MDEKFFPPDVAKACRDGDQKVIRSGKPLNHTGMTPKEFRSRHRG